MLLLFLVFGMLGILAGGINLPKQPQDVLQEVATQWCGYILSFQGRQGFGECVNVETAQYTPECKVVKKTHTHTQNIHKTQNPKKNTQKKNKSVGR